MQDSTHKILDIIQAVVHPEWPVYFVEVGANDGVSHSIGLGLLKSGWYGDMYEPCRATYQKLYKNLEAYPVNLYNFAISDRDSQAPLYYDNRLNGRQACATIADRVEGIHTEDFEIVPTRTLRGLGAHIEPTCLIIDTEGHDLEVLKGLFPIKPKLIITEVYKYFPDRYREKTQLLNSSGYCFHDRVLWDDVWIRKDCYPPTSFSSNF